MKFPPPMMQNASVTVYRLNFVGSMPITWIVYRVTRREVELYRSIHVGHFAERHLRILVGNFISESFWS